MIFFRYTLRLLFLTLVQVSIAKGDPVLEKCKLQQYSQSEWYGEYQFYSGDTHIGVISFDKVKGCEISGSFHWPHSFNTRTRISGVVENDKLKISNTSTYQGIISNLENQYYELDLTSTDTLKGVIFQLGSELATMTFYRADKLPEDKLRTFKQEIKELEEKYGTLLVGEKATIDLKTLKEEIIKKESELDTDVIINGRGIFSSIEVPLTMKMRQTGEMYMELDFMGTSFRMGSNDSISWSYDPTTDKVEVKPVEEKNESMNPFQSNFGSEWFEDKQIISVTDVQINGEKAYRVAYRNEDEIDAIYFSAADFFPVREKEGTTVREYSKYRSFNGTDIFTVFKDMGPGGEVNFMYLDDVQFVDELPEELFDIPSELRSKVTRNESSELKQVAQAAFDNEEYNRAVDLYTQAIQQSAIDHHAFYMRGRSRYILDDYYKALGDIERAIELNDQYADYHNYLGLIKYALADYTNAKSDFERTVQLDSTSYTGYLNYAFATYQLKEYDSAIVYLDKGIEFNPDNGQLYLNRGIIHYQLQQYEKSLSDYLEVEALEYGDRGELVNRIGVAYYGMELYDSAAVYFKAGVELATDNYQRQKNLGDAYYRLGTYDQAIATYRTAQSLLEEPNATLLNDLAMSYYHYEDYQTALVVLDELIALNSENASYFDNRAYTHTALMDYQNAIKDFSRSIDLYSTDKEIYYQRGLLYKLQNNRFDACRDFQTATDMEHQSAATEMKEYCTVATPDDN